jgi:hypothetical protein
LRGQLTEGRYLVFESNGQCLQNLDLLGINSLIVAPCAEGYKNAEQTFYVTQEDVFDQTFTLIYQDGSTVKPDTGSTVTIKYSSGKGYSIQDSAGRYAAIEEILFINYFQWQSEPFYFNVFSVTYNSL